MSLNNILAVLTDYLIHSVMQGISPIFVFFILISLSHFHNFQ